MPLYFDPPAAPLVPPTVNPSYPAHSLFRHYRPWSAGLNVFVVDGVVTTVEPDYSLVTPDHVYLGGHIHEVSAAEAALLTAAGYTVDEVPAPDPLLVGYVATYEETYS